MHTIGGGEEADDNNVPRTPPRPIIGVDAIADSVMIGNANLVIENDP